MQPDVMHSFTKLQVGMSTHSSSLNFYRSKEKKHQQNLKCRNRVGMRVQMELESKWNSCVKCKHERESHKKLKDKIFTWTMNPPHCLTQKCKKLSQLPRSWTLASEVVIDENH